MGSSTEADATRARPTLLGVIVALAAVAVSACGGDDGAPSSGTAGRIAAVRISSGDPPSYNPPKFDLLTLNEDGSGESIVLKAPRTGDAAMVRLSDPSWSPDGQWIYFTGSVEERESPELTYELTDVFAIRPDGGGLRRLTETGDAGRPVLSPDGETVLFMRLEHPGRLSVTSGMWLMDASGGEERRLLPVREGWLDLPGSWSPDGETIAFTRCRWEPPGPRGRVPNACAVATVSRAGSGVTPLAERARAPVYSPDGARIVFVTDRDENGTHALGSDEDGFANELYVMDADGGDPERLTSTEQLDESAASWSSDGERIVFAREGPARFIEQLMIVDADGGCAARIAGDATVFDARRSRDYGQPAWRPGAAAGAHPELECEEEG